MIHYLNYLEKTDTAMLSSEEADLSNYQLDDESEAATSDQEMARSDPVED
jgi:hypothetical protein